MNQGISRGTAFSSLALMRFESFLRAAHLHVFATHCVERCIFKTSAPRACCRLVSQSQSRIRAEQSVENQQDPIRLLQLNEISTLGKGAARGDPGQRLYTSEGNLLDGLSEECVMPCLLTDCVWG